MLPFCWSVAKSCPTLCDPTNCNTPGFLVLHYLLAWILKFMLIELVMLSNHLSSASPFCFCLQSFQASESFAVSWLFASGGQIIGASASVLVLPVSIQGWFPLGLTGLISLLSKGLSRTFSSTTFWKHQFFRTQPSLWSNFLIHIGKPIALTIQSFVNKVMSHCLDLTAFLPRRKHL